MKKVLTIIRKEYLERVRAKSFIIGTLLGPALMSMFIVIPMLVADSGGEDKRSIGVIDSSGIIFSRLADMLETRGNTNTTLLNYSVSGDDQVTAVDSLKSEILNGKVHSGIVLSANFIEDPGVTFYNRSVSSLVVRDEILRPALNTILRQDRFNEHAIPDSLFTYLVGRSQWESISITAEGGEEVQDEAVSFAMAFTLIMIIYIMVIIYGAHTLTAIIEEKSSRMVEVLLSSVSPENLMLGKVLGIGLAGLTQFGIWAVAFFILSQQGVSIGDFSLDASFLTPLILVSFFMFCLLGFFLYATRYAGFGALCNTVQDSQQFQMPLSMMLVIPMMLLSLVLRSPDSTLSVVLSLVPLFSPILMFMRVCVETPPMWQIGLSWLLMGGSILLASRMAGKLFRMGILMYGSSPTWASMVRTLRD